MDLECPRFFCGPVCWIPVYPGSLSSVAFKLYIYNTEQVGLATQNYYRWSTYMHVPNDVLVIV